MAESGEVNHPPLDRGGKRRGEKGEDLRHRRPHQADADGRTGLPLPVRGGLVHDGALGRVSPQRPAQGRGAHQPRQVRQVHHLHAPLGSAPPGPQALVRPARAFPLYRGVVHGRGHERADPDYRGHLRARAAQAEWGADPPDRSLEVRLQEHQVGGQDRIDRTPARHLLEPAGSPRIRVRLQRQPPRAPPPLVPGLRAGHRHPPPQAHPALQRL